MYRLKGWTIRLMPESSEGYCWQDEKIIDLGLLGNPLELLLHEVAHIGINPHGNKHNQEWFNEYIKLINKYMPGTDIGESEKIIQKIYKLKIIDKKITRKWFAVFVESDYPGWAYLLVILTLGLAIKPIEWYFKWKEK